MNGRSEHFVIVGGGLAAGKAAAALRSGGHQGHITIFTAEDHPPYERPPLSKDILLGKSEADDALVHPQHWYDEQGITLRTARPVTAIDPQARVLTTSAGQTSYDKLLLCTGSSPRHLPMADQSGADVHYLRTLDDSLALKSKLTEGARIAIIGGGWIGLEVASAARNAGAEVTVLEALEAPLVRVVGAEVAEIFSNLHREHGVDLRTGVTVTEIGPHSLTLEGGDTVEFDTLLVGVGAVPNVELAQAAGLKIDNGVRVDDHLRTSDPHIFAAGDIANADNTALGYPLRVEHWDTAIKQGELAAANMLGGDQSNDALPYFFTDQYDFGIEYIGNPGPEGFDQVELTGDVPGRVFRAYWLRDGVVVAAMHGNDWDATAELRASIGKPLRLE